ncbi:Uncharacterised protein [Mycobacterium tuberculosis]|nr:Uncharacterised protein [Mycobacterium tuberculosis]
MRVLCFQISTSCKKPLLTPSVNTRDNLSVISSLIPLGFSTMTPHCRTNEFWVTG